MRKKLYEASIIFFFGLCLFLIYLSTYYWSFLKIPDETIKIDIFNISNNKYDFPIKLPRDEKYNFYLRIYDPIGNKLFPQRIEDKYEITITSKIYDENNKALVEYHIDNNNLDVVSISEASFNWSLLPYNTFQGINDENYQLSLSFKVNDIFFDEIKKQIIIEQSYDSAAIPWVELFLQVALIMLLVSLSTLVFLIKYYKKKYLTLIRPPLVKRKILL